MSSWNVFSEALPCSVAMRPMPHHATGNKVDLAESIRGQLATTFSCHFEIRKTRPWHRHMAFALKKVEAMKPWQPWQVEIGLECIRIYPAKEPSSHQYFAQASEKEKEFQSESLRHDLNRTTTRLMTDSRTEHHESTRPLLFTQNDLESSRSQRQSSTESSYRF